MGWFAKFMSTVEGAQARQLTYVPVVPADPAVVPGLADPFTPGDCYVELYLESLRLSQARRFATKFSGVVYSFVTLARQGDASAKLAAVSKPQRLLEIDAAAIDSVITVSKQLMAPTPYYGGPISLEIGLFSVKSGNMVSSVIDYVSKVSAIAGISSVGAVAPFLPLLTEGMDLIAGQQADTALEVGLDTDQVPDTTCLSAIIDCESGSLDPTELSVNSDRHLFYRGRDIGRGYALFSLRASKTKPDFGELPDLRARYADFQSQLRSGDKSKARDALTAFRLTAIASSDLILADAQRLASLARQRFDAAFPIEGGVISETFIGRLPKEDLSAIGLYQ